MREACEKFHTVQNTFATLRPHFGGTWDVKGGLNIQDDSASL